MARQGWESRGELVERLAHGGGPGVDSRRSFGEAPKRRGNLNRNCHVLSPGFILQLNSALAPTAPALRGLRTLRCGIQPRFDKSLKCFNARRDGFRHWKVRRDCVGGLQTV